MPASYDKVILALPTLNEELAIEKMIQEIRSHVDIPLIVVDGFSTDRTTQKASALGAEVVPRTDGVGYGSAIKRALAVALERNYDWLFIMDCDMTYRPSEIVKILEKRDEGDLITGVRPMNRISTTHRIANLSHSWLATFLYGQTVGDINSGMRLMSVRKYANRLTEGNMGMVAQISSIALRNNWPICEVPIEYDKRIGISKIDLWDWFTITWCILRERFRRNLE